MDNDRCLQVAVELLGAFTAADAAQAAVLSVGGGPDDITTTLGALVTHPNPVVRGHLVNDDDTPDDQLGQLAGNPSQQIRWWVAGHANSSATTLLGLCDDESRLVRSRVARRLDITDALVVRLRTDPSIEVLSDLACNVAVDYETRQVLRTNLWHYSRNV